MCTLFHATFKDHIHLNSQQNYFHTQAQKTLLRQIGVQQDYICISSIFGRDSSRTRLQCSNAIASSSTPSSCAETFQQTSQILSCPRSVLQQELNLTDDNFDDYGRIFIKDLSFSQLRTWCRLQNLPQSRYEQLLRWIYRPYQRHGLALDLHLAKGKALSISQTFASKFHQVARLDGALEEVERITSSDGTIKLALKITHGKLAGKVIETVIMPRVHEKHHQKTSKDTVQLDRTTICISSQVGCAMNCQFCFTGRGGKTGSLSTAQIVEQVLIGTRLAREAKSLPSQLRVVFMGMGEPLDNAAHVLKAVQILREDSGFKLGRRSVLVSTVGIMDELEKMPLVLPFRLAISLHATEDSTRDWLVPPNKRSNLQRLIQQLELRYPKGSHDIVMIEYVMLKGINDTLEDAKRLADLLQNVQAFVNLIVFNPYPGTIFRQSDPASMEAFIDVLMARHVYVTVRRSKGSDDMAGCGQLGGDVVVPLSKPPGHFEEFLDMSQLERR